MWHQWSTNRPQSPQNEPETEEYDPFLHFAKRSKAVHRQQESISQQSGLSKYDESFWDKILQNPKEEPFNPHFADSFSIFSTASAGMVCGHTRNSPCLDELPSPAELMGRKKRRGGDAAERRATAVTHHITELRRKQSFIDQLKGEKWWGSSLGLWTEQGCVCAEEDQTEAETETHTHLITSPSSPQMLDFVPGLNPMKSFVVGGSAHREAHRKWEEPGVSSSEFWGFGYNMEE